MKILFLHESKGAVARKQANYLKANGHEVTNPALDYQDFDLAVRAAQADYDLHRPDVIVGFSRGGAIAMNMQTGDTPLVLLCPAWSKCGTATTVKQNTTILHSSDDKVVPFEDSEQLVKNSGLHESALIETGDGHRLDDPISLEQMLQACWEDRYHAIHESSHAVVGIGLGLTPKEIAIGRTSRGTYGGVEFCLPTNVRRDRRRCRMIAVSGYMGTRMFGYGNATVSTKLRRLKDGDEPGWNSDEWRVWRTGGTFSELEQTEEEARQLLEKDRDAIAALSNALLDRRTLEKEDIMAIYRSTSHGRSSRTN